MLGSSQIRVMGVLLMLIAILTLASAEILTYGTQVYQQMARMDLAIPFEQFNSLSTQQIQLYFKKPQNLSVELELPFGEETIETGDVYFCLSDKPDDPCISSSQADIYHQNFRSKYLYLTKPIQAISEESTADAYPSVYLTMVFSERLMELRGMKIAYQASMQLSSLDSIKTCPFGCSSRGRCEKGLCKCNESFIGRSCEFKLKSIDRSQQIWRAQLAQDEVVWLKLKNYDQQYLLVDFLSGFAHIVAFENTHSFDISSQYLLNHPQKVLIESRREQQNQLTDKGKGQSDEDIEVSESDSSFLLYCIAYSGETQFTVVMNSQKIEEIAQEYDKDLQFSRTEDILTILMNILITLLLISLGALFWITKKFRLEKSKLSVLELYKSMQFRDISEDLQHEDTCRICLEGYLEDTLVRTHYKCKKVFHKSCFDKWALTGNMKCPQCRTDYEPVIVEVLRKNASLAQPEAILDTSSNIEQPFASEIELQDSVETVHRSIPQREDCQSELYNKGVSCLVEIKSLTRDGQKYQQLEEEIIKEDPSSEEFNSSS